jgi:hypothetical protein
VLMEPPNAVVIDTFHTQHTPHVLVVPQHWEPTASATH